MATTEWTCPKCGQKQVTWTDDKKVVCTACGHTEVRIPQSGPKTGTK